MLLGKSTIFRSKDVNQTIDFIENLSSATIHNVHKIKKHEDAFICNHVSAHEFDMFYVVSNMASTIYLHPVNYIRLVFQVEGTSRILIEGHEITSSAKKGGYILPEGVFAKEKNLHGFRSLALRVNPNSLRQKLENLSGTRIEGSVRFEQPADLEQNLTGFLRQAVFNTAHEIDIIDQRFHAYILDELKEVVLTRLLLHLRHNYSHLLQGKEPDIDHKKIAKIEDYIRSNPSKTLSLGLLAEIGGVSERTIQRHFSRMYNTNPSRYIRRTRLDLARKKLLETEDEGCVLAIALSCGFKSFGHFAEIYKSRFGELPSATLKRRKSL